MTALMLFDGLCGFCSGSVLFVAARSAPQRLRFSPMQSTFGRATLQNLGLPTEDFETLVVVEAGRIRVKSDAVLRLGALMCFPWPLLAALARQVPEPLRDRLYDLVARNRYRIRGRRDHCVVPRPELAARFVR